MPKSTAASNNILNLMYRAVAWANVADNAASSPITVVQLAFATASYTISSTLATAEATYTNYVRPTVPRTTGGWDAASGGAIANTNPVEGTQCGVTGNTLTSAATGKGAGAGEVWHYGDLNAPIADSNQIQPRFPAGAITITEA